MMQAVARNCLRDLQALDDRIATQLHLQLWSRS
jgi:hypothetical protein